MTVSLLEANIDESADLPHACKHIGSVKAWLDVELYINPLKYFCIYHYLKMEFNNATGEFSSPKGISVNTINFGFPNSTIASVPFTAAVTTKLFTFLQGMNYTFGTNMFVAPYDWRKSPVTLVKKTEFRARLMNLIEKAVLANGKRAILLSHSNGGPLQYEFLKDTSQEWRDKNIGAAIFVSSNWVGQFNVFRDVTFSSGKLLKKMQV